MRRFDFVCLKLVRWSGWPLLPLVLGFLFTGYLMSGRFGFGRWMTAEQALALHKWLHLPLMVLLLAHVVPAVYLALQRWGWIRR
jgi:hypothetical protein